MMKLALCLPAVLVWSSTAGCALLSKASPLPLRFFTPTGVEQAAPARVVPESGLSLRLGRIESAKHVEQRIAFRNGPTELSYYQGLRWTESPEFYLRTRLTGALFDDRGVRRIISGPGPTLDVELNEFEELQYGQRRARIALRFVLRDERRALIEQLVVEEQAVRPVEGQISEEGLPDAMARALDSAVSRIATRVVTQLEALETAPNPSSEPSTSTPESSSPSP